MHIFRTGFAASLLSLGLSSGLAAQSSAQPGAVAPPAPAAAVANAVVYPALEALTLTGARFSSADPVRRRPTLLIFWAAWCATCRSESPAFIRLHQRHGKRLRMAGIAVAERESRADVILARKQLGLNYPVIYDADRSLMQLYNIQMVPQLLLLDADGRLLLRTTDAARMENTLADLLKN